MLRGPRKAPILPPVQHEVDSALADEARLPPAMPVLEREGPISRRLWSPAVDLPTMRLPKKRGLHTARVLLCMAAIGLLGSAVLLAQQRLSAGRGTQARMGSTTTRRGHVTQAYSLQKIPTATPQPSATATATLPPLPNFSAIPPFCNADLLGNTPAPGTPTPAGCANCPYIYDQTQYPIVQVQAALQQAAALYQLPPILVEAISWEESGWTNTGVINYSYDTGLMGLKQATGSGSIRFQTAIAAPRTTPMIRSRYRAMPTWEQSSWRFCIAIMAGVADLAARSRTRRSTRVIGIINRCASCGQISPKRVVSRTPRACAPRLVLTRRSTRAAIIRARGPLPRFLLPCRPARHGAAPSPRPQATGPCMRSWWQPIRRVLGLSTARASSTSGTSTISRTIWSN